MNEILKFFSAFFKRMRTALTSPFRQLGMRIQRVLNANVLSSKVAAPATKKLRSLFKLKPQNTKEYYSILGLWVYKKLVYVLVLAACAFVFIYFGAIAKQPDPPVTQLTGITTNITFRYDDIDLSEFTGVANIRNHEGNIAFTGEIEAGVCRGMGVLYNAEGQMVYKGAFDNNMYNGAGTKYGENGAAVYEGEFADNKYEGQGRQFDPDGALIYEGAFKAGAYEGEGVLWNEEGLSSYEGQFMAGLKHGAGRQYFESGKLHYEGEFYAGEFSGAGALYAENGLLLYNGRMHGGRIDFLSLLGASLADASASFTETPVIFYQDGNACYLYRQAGILLTTDCRVQVQEWQASQQQQTGQTWFMPSQYPELYLAASNPLLRLGAGQQAQAASSSGQAQGGASSSAAQSASSGQAASSSQSSASSSSSSGQAASSSGQPAAATAASSASSSTSSATGGEMPWPFYEEPPDFIDRFKVLYFEVDKDVWEYEPEKYEPKVLISKVTVLDAMAPDEETQALDDDPPPGMEDCIAVDALRQSLPTAFPDVFFEIDKQNKLFQRVWNISHASNIRRLSYVDGSVIWRFCYDGEDAEAPTYFSVER